MGTHISISLIVDRDIEYLININVGKQNEEYNRFYVNHKIQQNI